jgi:broad specificity phosphatase PhoE
MSKSLYCIRHGLAEHNINYFKYGCKTFYDPKFVDTSLVEEGFKQASTLGETWSEINDIELVVVSPLKRALQTTTEIFKGKSVPIISFELAREYPIGGHTCNKRSQKEYLMNTFPTINFDDIKEGEDNLWDPEVEESIHELDLRINIFKKFIEKRPEKNIALVSHGSFIGQLKDNHIKYIENGEEELKHCYPYLIKLNNS